MVMTVIGFFMMLKDAGLSAASIQKEGITHEQVSNLFWVNIVFSAILCLIMLVIAHPIAWFYKEPQLANIAFALSVTFLLLGSTFQHQALLKRQMQFKKIAVIEIGAISLGLITAVSMAILGYGYWSLVWQNIMMALATLVLTWVFSGWRPGPFTRNCGTRPLLNLGINLTGASLLQAFSRMVEYFLIGRFFGAKVLGLYSKSNSLLMNPLQNLLSPLASVSVPVLSRLQNDEERYRKVFFQIYETMAILTLPMSGLLIVISEPLIDVVLGSKWHEAAPFFALFTILAVYAPFAHAIIWLLTSQGRGKDLLHVSMINSFLSICSIAAGLPFGAMAVVSSYTLSGLFIRLPVLSFFAGRSGPVGTFALFTRLSKHIPLWIGVAAAAYITRFRLSLLDPISQVCITVLVGIIMSIILILIFRYERRIVAHTLIKLKKNYIKK